MNDIINYTISNFQGAQEIREHLAKLQMNGWHLFYRGHGSTNYKLLPSIARKRPFNGNILRSEIDCLNDFKSLVELEEWGNFRVQSYDIDMFYMSAGRHMGLDCRLLDWTAKLETAIFFASEGEINKENNGHLWIMCYHGTVDDSAAKLSPFDIDVFTLVKEATLLPDDFFVNCYNIPEGVLRRERQNGFFSIMPTDKLYTPLNEIKFDNVYLIPILILASAKKDIISNLPNDYADYLHISSCPEIQKSVTMINSKYFKHPI